MANVAAGDLFQVSIVGNVFGERVIMTRTWQVLDAPSVPTTINEYADEIHAEYTKSGGILDQYEAVLSASWVGEYIRYQCVAPIRYAMYDKVLTGSEGLRGEVNATTLAAAVTLRTEKSGRDQIANMHIGPIADVDLVGGVVKPELVNLLQTLGESLVTAMEEIGPDSVLIPVIWHTKVPGPTISVDELSTALAQTSARTMRRRVVGRGE